MVVVSHLSYRTPAHNHHVPHLFIVKISEWILDGQLAAIGFVFTLNLSIFHVEFIDGLVLIDEEGMGVLA